MFNNKSIYALNKKDPDAIVCPDAYSDRPRITRAQLAGKNFQKWKELSDEDYHQEDKRDHVQANHTISLTGLPENAISVPAIDVALEYAEERREQQRQSHALVLQIRSRLTEKQFRRLWMHKVDEMTEAQIAKIEGVSQQAISLSIRATVEKIRKIFGNDEKHLVKPA